MKNSITFGFVFLVHSLFIATLLPLSHSLTDSNNLIAQTCKQTPYYNLCVTSLKSDPRSSNAADVRGLALIMVDIVRAKASATLQLINQELKRSTPELKRPLSSCASNYDAVLTVDIPEAVKALQKGDPKFGENEMTDAANEARFCEAVLIFYGQSHLTNLNKVVHYTSVVAAAIIRQLL